MTPTEVASLKGLGRALKPAAVSQRYILCPGCDQHSGEVCADPHGGRICRCPECGPVAVEGSDLAAWKLDEEWFHRSLRRALDIQSHDGVVELAGGVWRLGDARKSPVVLARDLSRLWREPSLIERVRSTTAATRVISPRPDQLRGKPFDDLAGVNWLPLEQRFMLHGDGISYIDGGDGGDGSAMVRAVDPSVPVHGPFSEDFRWVSLKGWSHGPIQLSDSQSAMFRLLWELAGKRIEGDLLMRKIGSGSDRPMDLFKLKKGQKDKPEYEGPLFAYRKLVDPTRSGDYSLPRDQAFSLVLQAPVLLQSPINRQCEASQYE
jgi:hypothetical protein